VYVVGDDQVVFLFLSTRKRVRITCRGYLIDALQWMDGCHSMRELRSRVEHAANDPDASEQVEGFVTYLVSKSIVVDAAWMDHLELPVEYVTRLNRHLAFLLDLEGGADAVKATQTAIYRSRVAIVGVGAVGSWFCRLLPMVGFRQFVLVDPSRMPSSAVARELSYKRERVGRARVDCGREEILAVDPAGVVDAVQAVIRPQTDLNALFRDVDIIVNTADEPYIGYLNVLLSRYVVASRKLLLAAGGFDAHLGCFGELLIPGRTPCADCYARHFKHALRDWKPAEHPVPDRARGAGGMASLAAYSAAQGTLSLLRYFLPSDADFSARAELLFDDYRVERFAVQRDPACSTCSGLR
jgi:molybdopterin/thiamine biosynthesis adenylyltransferase